MGCRDKRVQAAVDCLVLDQGSYAPVELPLYLGRLPYARWEARRSGEMGFLEDGLSGNLQRGVETLVTAASQAGADRAGVRNGIPSTRRPRGCA